MKKKVEIMMKCECCHKKIVWWAMRKYCNACGPFISDLKKKVAHYKMRLEKLSMKHYGAPNGRSRKRGG